MPPYHYDTDVGIQELKHDAAALGGGDPDDLAVGGRRRAAG
jgi:hypothetical protein